VPKKSDRGARGRRAGFAPQQILIYLLAAFFTLLVLLPLVYMVLVALQPAEVAGTVLVPKKWDWYSFVDIWSTIDLANYLKNSLVVSLVTAAASSVVGFGAAYVLGRFRFRFRETFRISLLACYTTPGIVLLIPLYVVYIGIQDLIAVNFVGSRYLLILTYLTFSLPYTIWMLTGYLASLPDEIEEAAAVDGANRLQILRRVVFPLALPGLVVTAIFSFLMSWNDVLFASVLTNTDTRTVGMGIESFVSTTADGGVPQWNNLMAASLVTALPAVVLFLFIQRYLIGGLTAGSVKG
jgi:multiple sugar transport system permease protein